MKYVVGDSVSWFFKGNYYIGVIEAVVPEGEGIYKDCSGLNLKDEYERLDFSFEEVFKFGGKLTTGVEAYLIRQEGLIYLIDISLLQAFRELKMASIDNLPIEIKKDAYLDVKRYLESSFSKYESLKKETKIEDFVYDIFIQIIDKGKYPFKLDKILPDNLQVVSETLIEYLKENKDSEILVIIPKLSIYNFFAIEFSEWANRKGVDLVICHDKSLLLFPVTSNKIEFRLFDIERISGRAWDIIYDFNRPGESFSKDEVLKFACNKKFLRR